jgi:hypothetical protein
VHWDAFIINLPDAEIEKKKKLPGHIIKTILKDSIRLLVGKNSNLLKTGFSGQMRIYL